MNVLLSLNMLSTPCWFASSAEINAWGRQIVISSLFVFLDGERESRFCFHRTQLIRRAISVWASSLCSLIAPFVLHFDRISLARSWEVVPYGMSNLGSSLSWPYLIPFPIGLILFHKSASKLLDRRYNWLHNSAFISLWWRVNVALQVLLDHLLESLVSWWIPPAFSPSAADIQSRRVFHRHSIAATARAGQTKFTVDHVAAWFALQNRPQI